MSTTSRPPERVTEPITHHQRPIVELVRNAAPSPEGTKIVGPLEVRIDVHFTVARTTWNAFLPLFTRFSQFVLSGEWKEKP